MAKRSKLQNRAEYVAVRLFFGILGIFPLTTSMRIGKGFAGLVFRLFPKLHKTGRRNLEIAMPELSTEEQEKILRGTFLSLGRHLGFIAHLRKFTAENVQEIVEVVGKENFYKAYEDERGMLFFTGHFGSWEVFNLLSPAYGYKMNILVRRLDNPLVESYVNQMRTRFGNLTIDKRQSARTMFRLLQDGKILGILADLNVQEREGVFVDFFGIPASTTTSIAKLALRTNSIVLPAFAVWNKEKQKYVVHLESPLEYEKTSDNKKDIEKLTQDITKVVEQYVRKYPEQWLWIHKRWNTRPEGEEGLY